MLLERSILSGTPGTAETIMAMRQAVSRGKRLPSILLLVGQLAQGCAHKDRRCWAQQAFDYIRQRVAYVNHPHGVEVVMDADKTLMRGAGDCDQMSVAFNTLVEAMGLRSWFKTIMADGRRPSEWSHVYALVDVPGVGRLAADCAEGGGYLGWEPPGTYTAQMWPGSME